MPPATEFLRRAFAEKDVVKGIICHGMWLVAPMPELIRGRPVVCHNNLHGDIVNMGGIYTDHDVVIDGDLVTGRTGGHCHLFARAIIDMLIERSAAATAAPRGRDHRRNSGTTTPPRTPASPRRHRAHDVEQVVHRLHPDHGRRSAATPNAAGSGSTAR